MTDAIKAKDFDKAMALRDPEFRESLEGFFITSVLGTEPLLPPAQRIRVGIMQYVHLSPSLQSVLPPVTYLCRTAWVLPLVA